MTAKQKRSAPNCGWPPIALASSEVLFQMAKSPVPGTTPFDQLSGSFSAVVLFAFTLSANAYGAIRSAAMEQARGWRTRAGVFMWGLSVEGYAWGRRGVPGNMKALRSMRKGKSRPGLTSKAESSSEIKGSCRSGGRCHRNRRGNGFVSTNPNSGCRALACRMRTRPRTHGQDTWPELAPPTDGNRRA